MNTKESTLRLWDWTLVKTIMALSLLLFAALFLFGGYTEESTRQAIRWTARISTVLFSFAFAASALHHLLQNSFSFWLRQNRKYIGISFAFIHLIHLLFLGLLQASFHPVFDMAKTSSLIGGGMAYGFLVLMLLTSFPTFSRKLSPKNWKRLHTVGGYWIWFIFFKSYWKRALTEPEHIPIVLLLAGVLLVRLWYLWKKNPAIQLSESS